MAAITSSSKEITLNAPEAQVRSKLMEIPSHVKTFEVISSSALSDNIKYFYGNKQLHKSSHIHIDVSTTPISENKTKVNITSSYADGQSFQDSVIVDNAIRNTENALISSLEGKISEFKEETVKVDGGQAMLQLIILIVAIIAIAIAFGIL